GMEILQIIKKNYPNTLVIMLSGQEHYGVAMKTIINGAEKYVIKDKDAFEEVAKIINEAN
ncbi:MAG: sigma-54-dependent Fis family transcriptional regulator, partial [Moheibacter sp.]